jgi:hypothetical protein
MKFNLFRVLGDVSHLASICVLIWAMHRNRSAEGRCSDRFRLNLEAAVANTLLCSVGVSLLTQLLYGVVFIFRYLDLLEGRSWDVKHGGFGTLWNLSFKFFYLTSSFYLVFIMMKVYPRTRERERAWKLGIYSVLGSLVMAPIMMTITKDWPTHWFLEVRTIDSHPRALLIYL